MSNPTLPGIPSSEPMSRHVAPRCVSTSRAGLHIWRCSESQLILERGLGGGMGCGGEGVPWARELPPTPASEAGQMGSWGHLIYSMLCENTELTLPY